LAQRRNISPNEKKGRAFARPKSNREVEGSKMKSIAAFKTRFMRHMITFQVKLAAHAAWRLCVAGMAFGRSHLNA
jgi:hypothetical protein